MVKKREKKRDLAANLSIFDKGSSELCVHKIIHMLNILKSDRRLNMKIERNSSNRIKRRKKIYKSFFLKLEGKFSRVRFHLGVLRLPFFK